MPAAHQVLFSLVLHECTGSGHRGLAEPTNHSNLTSEISWVLQIKTDLHEEQRNLCTVQSRTCISRLGRWLLPACRAEPAPLEGGGTERSQFRKTAPGLLAVQGQLLELIAAGCQQDKIQQDSRED